MIADPSGVSCPKALIIQADIWTAEPCAVPLDLCMLCLCSQPFPFASPQFPLEYTRAPTLSSGCQECLVSFGKSCRALWLGVRIGSYIAVPAVHGFSLIVCAVMRADHRGETGVTGPQGASEMAHLVAAATGRAALALARAVAVLAAAVATRSVSQAIARQMNS